MYTLKSLRYGPRDVLKEFLNFGRRFQVLELLGVVEVRLPRSRCFLSVRVIAVLAVGGLAVQSQ